MDQVGEVGALDFLRLMKDYLERRLDVDQYREAYFELSTRRINVHDEEISRTVERAYGDADDYDPEVRLPYTIKELELRERVAKSVGELIKRGVLAHPADESG